MADIRELKQRIDDLHELAERLGMERPGGKGNYRSPHHKDKNPSLSIYDDGSKWKDHSSGEGGDCVDLVCYARGCDAGEAVKLLHEWYGIPFDRQERQAPREKSLAEFIAQRSLEAPERAIEYLTGRGIEEEVIREAIRRKAVGFNDYHSMKVAAGEHGHGGPAVAFIVRSLNPGQVVAVDLRYLDPELNGGTKTQCQGEKAGAPWFVDYRQLERAHTVYVVESPINALSVNCCNIKGSVSIATRGAKSVVESIDWHFLRGKRVVLCLDNDEPDENHSCPGQEAAWMIYERLTGLNIAAHLVDQSEWEHNDVNDFLQAEGPQELLYALKKLQPWVIPGLPGNSDKQKGRARIFLPLHDYSQYWRYRAKEDHTTLVSTKTDKETGEQKEDYSDLCGFRIASISRVTVASAAATMSGEADSQPRTLFAVSVQAPRHGNNLVRKVFEDERLHNTDQWQKLGPVYNRTPFLRLVNILERGTDLGARDAVNFVGLAWRNGRLIVNEGPDCYYTDPDKQCPYHNLTFPSGSTQDARQVVAEYQATFRKNAATVPLVWGLGAHLKAFLGFWPHLTMQASKGAGKSTLIKRLERTIAFTMFSGQSLQTEFRLLTSISHTSHPVGWEELSARRQDVIDKAVSLLQESYQYTVTRRGSDMTEYLLSAPVLLAGEDVPVRNLLGKVVRTDLSGKQGPLLPDNLPRFPLREWLDWLAECNRTDVVRKYREVHEYCLKRCRASADDGGARRMAGNYAAVLVAWKLLTEFCGTDWMQGEFVPDLLEEMNTHIAETIGDREPWVMILETLFSEIEAGNYRFPYRWDTSEGETCVFVRPSHVMDHIAHSMALREKWNALSVKSARVLRKQIIDAGVVAVDDAERTINAKRYAHLVGLSVDRLARYGLHPAPPESLEDIRT